MKKRNLESLIVVGLLSGSLVAGKSFAAVESNKSSNTIASIATNDLDHSLMTEDELLNQLNDESTKIYQSLSPEAKKLAIRVASSNCSGENACKGLNACKTDKNGCAGQGECKGQGKCAPDPNVAIKLVEKKAMSEKRQKAIK